jgi:hypothetical protein
MTEIVFMVFGEDRGGNGTLRRGAIMNANARE